MSDKTPVVGRIEFSSIASPNTWNIDGDSKMLVFASPSEAKRAEELFSALQAELAAVTRERDELRALWDGEKREHELHKTRMARVVEAEARAEAAETELLGVKEYREKNPLGGPAKVLDAMADRIRAGDDFMAVLRDYGFYTADEMRAAEKDARCFRFWVREAANAPGDMARLIANCVTEQDYRDKIEPLATAAEDAIRAAMEAGRE